MSVTTMNFQFFCHLYRLFKREVKMDTGQILSLFACLRLESDLEVHKYEKKNESIIQPSRPNKLANY